ncbi:MAG: PilX N-terminal domain-containing pilus assembly protein [Pseudomonadota bacterium]
MLTTRQRGAALLTVMMIMIVVSMLGLAAVEIAIMSERGSRNDRDLQLALQSAEAALADAAYDIDGTGATALSRPEVFAADSAADFKDGCGDAGSGHGKGLCMPALAGQPVWLTVDFVAPQARSRTVSFGEFTGRSFAAADADGGNGLMPALKPRYIIEAVPDGEVFADLRRKTGYVYRVTALGFGPRQDVQALLQMVYRKKRD